MNQNESSRNRECALKHWFAGGNVRIEEDPKRSQGRYKVPRKASIGGVKARRFLGFSLKDCEREEKKIMFNQWKHLHRVVKDNAAGVGQSIITRQTCGNHSIKFFIMWSSILGTQCKSLHFKRIAKLEEGIPSKLGWATYHPLHGEFTCSIYIYIET